MISEKWDVFPIYRYADFSFFQPQDFFLYLCFSELWLWYSYVFFWGVGVGVREGLFHFVFFFGVLWASKMWFGVSDYSGNIHNHYCVKYCFFLCLFLLVFPLHIHYIHYSCSTVLGYSIPFFPFSVLAVSIVTCSNSEILSSAMPRLLKSIKSISIFSYSVFFFKSLFLFIPS